MRGPDRLGRRTVLTAASVGGLLAACGSPALDRQDDAMAPERLPYGQDPAQYGDLYRPAGTSRGVVVVLHGGFWRSVYDASLGEPLATDLAARGWTAYNLEYRRVGDGGGWPTTFDDVADGIDRLADVEDLDLDRVVTLGHSAGGHLAAWAAARGRFELWQPPRVAVTAVVSQAGVLDLTAGARQGLGGGAVEAFLGQPPGPSYDLVDPQRQLPLEVPVWCVHGAADTIVPLSQSAGYVDAATDAGAQAELVEVSGDHFVVIDPASDAWQRTVDILDDVPR